MLKEKEKKILLLIAAGNQSVFDHLFRSYYKYLVTIAYSYTKDLELSKDLTQEVFLDFWKRRQDIIIKSSLKSFLKKAVVNQSIAALKKKKHSSLSETTIVLEERSTPQQTIEYDELHNKIQSIIESLPSKCKEIFLLSRFQHLSHKEIAKQMEISTKTIEGQITKALKILRNKLQEDHLLSWFLYGLCYLF